MAANSLPGVLQVSGKQRSLIDLKRWSHLATKLKALAHNKSEVDAQAQIYKNITSFEISLGSLGFRGLGLHQTSYKQPFCAVSKKVPVYFSCFGKCYSSYLAVLPTTKQLLTFPSTSGLSRWLNSHFLVNCSFKLHDEKGFRLGVTGSILKLVTRSSSATVPCSRSTTRPLRHKINLTATCQEKSPLSWCSLRLRVHSVSHATIIPANDKVDKTCTSCLLWPGAQ